MSRTTRLACAAGLIAHVTDCIATPGSMAGLFGPNGAMVEGTTEAAR